MKLKLLFILVTLILIPKISMARVGRYSGWEIKMTGGINNINPDDLNKLNQSLFGASYPNIDKASGGSLDGAYYFDFGLGLGLRSETLMASVSSLGTQTDVTAIRLAPMIGYRFFNENWFLGTLLTVGIGHGSVIKYKTTVPYFDSTTSTGSSSSLSIEGGAKFGWFMLGLELGYLKFVNTDIQYNNSSRLYQGRKTDLDMSGSYGRVILGAAFF